MRSSITTSKHTRSLNRRGVSLVLTLLVVALGLIMLDRAGLLAPLKGTSQRLLQPLEGRLTRARLSVGATFSDLWNTGSLRSRNAELEREVARLKAEVIGLQGLRADNDALARQLGMQQGYGWITVAAPVIQSNAENGRRMIRIGRGRVDGLQVGMAVIAKEGGNPPALVGTVDRVYAQGADVLLITDGASSVAARTTTRTPARGLVVGQWQLGSRIKLEEVDRDAALALGDVVVTAGLSKGAATDTPMAQVPPNVPLGVVVELQKNNRHQSAELQPFVDPDRVREVWVITREQSISDE